MLRGMLAVAAGLATCVALTVEASPEASATPRLQAAPGPGLSQLLALNGLSIGSTAGWLMRLDPQTLRPLRGKRIAVEKGGCASQDGGTLCWVPAWAVSPDGKRLVLAESTPRGVSDAPSLRLVDPAAMRTIARIPVAGGAIGALAWLRPDRVLAVQEATDGGQQVVAVDLATRRVAPPRSLDGSVERLATTEDELVVLVAPPNEIAPARIDVVDPDGNVHSARLDRILAGWHRLQGDELRIDSRVPGLAVDPATERAFVVVKGAAAEVDLRTLAVSYHELAERKPSFLSRLRGWLDPAASAKELSGSRRVARWLGNGLLAVSGSDEQRGDVRPAGLSLVDTTTWAVRTIEPGAMTLAAADGALLTTGWTSDGRRATGIGLTAYRPDGTLRFHLFGDAGAWLQVYGRRAFVGLIGRPGLRIVDLETGAVVGTRRADLPLLLVGSSGGRWGSG